jgi:protein-disulfide isomerase
LPKLDDESEAQSIGITGTPPTLLVGLKDNGQLKSVRLIRGAMPFPSLKAAIDELLSSAK